MKQSLHIDTFHENKKKMSLTISVRASNITYIDKIIQLRNWRRSRFMRDYKILAYFIDLEDFLSTKQITEKQHNQGCLRIITLCTWLWTCY